MKMNPQSPKALQSLGELIKELYTKGGEESIKPLFTVAKCIQILQNNEEITSDTFSAALIDISAIIKGVTSAHLGYDVPEPVIGDEFMPKDFPIFDSTDKIQ